MKVLLSAFACAPGEGSEPEVGFQILRIIAAHHAVWVLTQEHMAAATQEHLAVHPLPNPVEFVVVGPPARPKGPGLRGWWELHREHDAWQRNAAERAVELDLAVDFDLVHHATLAAYWMRTGVAAVDKPLVWGPVGGGVVAPTSLLTELRGSGLAEDAVRTVVRSVAARTPVVQAAVRRAAVTFAQNPATARKLRGARHLKVMNNALSFALDPVLPDGPRTPDVLVVGRLIPWKAAPLAVRAFARISHPDARLKVYGTGPDRDAILRAARRHGVADRTQLLGAVPRAQLLRDLAHAGVLLHPSLHDEGGTIVAEALTLGTPVVCLDHGGPAELTRQWPQVAAERVAPRGPRQTAAALAAAVDRLLDLRPPVSTTTHAPRQSFATELLDAYRMAAG